MAAAAQNSVSSQTLIAVKNERAAIDLIDSFIDSQMKILGEVLYGVLLNFLDLKRHSPEITRYIGTSAKKREEFISRRKHLWTLGEDDGFSIIQKSTRRSVLRCIVTYIEYRTEKDEILGAAKLKDISSVMGQKFPQIRQELGKGFDPVKSFLLEYPALFQKLRSGPDTRVEDLLFLSKAIVYDDVIVFKDYIDEVHPVLEKSVPAVAAVGPDRFEGIGTIIYYVPPKYYGFIRDEKTQEEAYFSLSSVQPTWIKTEEILALKNEGQKFKFEAVISNEYVVGSVKNKWRVIFMTPAGGWMDTAGGTATSGSRIQKVEADQTGRSASPGNQKFTPTPLAEMSTDSKNSSASVSKSIEKESKISAIKSIENDFMPTLSQEIRNRFSSESAKAQMTRIDTHRNHVIDGVSMGSSHGDLLPSESSSFKSYTFSEKRVQEFYEHYERSAANHPEKREGSLKTKNTQDISSPIASTKPKSAPGPPGFDHIQKGQTPGVSAVPSGQNQTQAGYSVKAALKNSNQIKKRQVEKNDIACQTDANDDWSLLMRMFRNSPDLLKLVRAMRIADP